MSLPLVAAALVVVVGGILCVVGRDARTIVAGLFLALAAAPLLTDPLPDLTSLAARVAAAGVVAELAWIGLRDRPDVGPGARTGWIAQAIFVLAAVAGALGLHDPATALGAPDLARAAGFALLVVAVPGLFGGSPVRTGVAVMLLVGAALLLQVALTMRPTPFAHLLAGLVEVAAAGAMIMVLQLSAIRAPEAAVPGRGGSTRRRGVGPFVGAEAGGSVGAAGTARSAEQQRRSGSTRGPVPGATPSAVRGATPSAVRGATPARTTAAGPGATPAPPGTTPNRPPRQPPTSASPDG